MGLWDFQPNLTSTESALGNQYLYQYQEHTNLQGYPYKYIKAVETESNDIFNESTARDFLTTNGYSIKVKKDEDQMFSGSEVFGGFGYLPSYSNIIYIPSLTLTELNIEPLEGDLMYDEISKVLFQITKVDTLTETQLNLKINDLVLARKVYLKQYQFSYKDNFDDTTEDELFEIETSLEELDKLNDTLNTNIDNTDSINKNDIDNVFGDFR